MGACVSKNFVVATDICLENFDINILDNLFVRKHGDDFTFKG